MPSTCSMHRSSAHALESGQQSPSWPLCSAREPHGTCRCRFSSSRRGVRSKAMCSLLLGMCHHTRSSEHSSLMRRTCPRTHGTHRTAGTMATPMSSPNAAMKETSRSSCTTSFATSRNCLGISAAAARAAALSPLLALPSALSCCRVEMPLSSTLRSGISSSGSSCSAWIRRPNSVRAW